MSQVSKYDMARQEALHAGAQPRDLLEALQTINRLEAVNAALLRNQSWARGCKGDGAAKIPGLTDTLTALVRRFAACGIVRHSEMNDLHRHKSALCKALKTLAPEVKIETVIGVGYEIVAGFDGLYRLLHAGQEPSIKLEGFTVKQTAILKLIALRGSVHVDQIACLQRHMSNIRAAIKHAGHAKRIVLATHPGEGLYTIDDRSRANLTKLLAGEPMTEPKASKRNTPSEPALTLFAA